MSNNTVTENTRNTTETKMPDTSAMHLVLQQKGGAGKSTLATLVALKYDSLGLLDSKKPSEKAFAIFIDADNETYSLSTTQLFLRNRTPAALFVAHLVDEKKKMVRDKLLTQMETWAELQGKNIYIDFGAGESAQLAHILELDYSIEQIKKYADSIDVKLIFDIVVAGGSNFQIHSNFLAKMVQLVKGYFEVNIWLNQYTFNGQVLLIDEIKDFFENANKNLPGSIASLNYFGGFDTQSEVTDGIIKNLSLGKSYKEYSFLEKMKLDNEFTKLK